MSALPSSRGFWLETLAPEIEHELLATGKVVAWEDYAKVVAERDELRQALADRQIVLDQNRAYHEALNRIRGTRRPQASELHALAETLRRATALTDVVVLADALHERATALDVEWWAEQGRLRERKTRKCPTCQGVGKIYPPSHVTLDTVPGYDPRIPCPECQP